MTEPQPEMRIGDRERQAIDQRLRVAHADGVLTLGEYDERAAACFAARTQSDLDALVRDLPPAADAPSLVKPAAAAPQPAPARPVQRRNTQGLRNGLIGVGVAALVVFGATQVVGAPDGASLFGSNRVTVVPGDDRVDVGMMFGTVTVVVPDGMQASPSGFVIFGSKNCDLACQPGPPGSKQVVVHANGAFGSVNIVRPGETLSKKDKDDD